MGHFAIRVGIFALLISACAPSKSAFDSKGSNGSQLSFRLKKKTSGKWYSALEGGAFEASADFCYALHVTGPAAELRRLPPPKVSTCENAPPGLGKVVGLFSKGETIEVDIPIGLDRRFDLFAYPKAMMPDGECVHAFRVDPPAAGSSSQMQFFLDGVEFKGKAQLIASATVEIKEGVNDIDLVAAGDSAIGVPYGCNGLPTVTVETPSSGDIMSARTLGQYGAAGLCSESGQVVKLTIGSLELETLCQANETWSLIPFDFDSASDGAYVMKVSHRDIAGNWSATREVPFTKNSTLTFARSVNPPSSVSATSPIFSSLTVTMTDANGQVTDFDSGAMELKGYTDSSCSTDATPALRSGVLSPVVATVTDGVASFSNVNYPSAQSSLYIQAVFGTAKGDCMGPIDVSANGGHKFAITSVMPSSPYTASTASNSVDVEYRDYFDNPETIVSGSHAVGFYTYDDATCPAGQGNLIAQANLTAGNSSVTISGVAFTDARVRAIGISFYGGTPPDANAGSGCIPFRVDPDSGGALKFGIVDLPSASLSSSVSNNMSLAVEVQDSFGNPVSVPSSANTSVTKYTSGSCSTGSLYASSVNISNPDSKSSAQIATLSTTGQYWFKAAADTGNGILVSSCAGPVTVAGTVQGIAFSTNPPTSVASTGTFPIAAKIVDGSGNQVGNSGDTITFTAHTSASCTGTAVSFFKQSNGSAATGTTTAGALSLTVKNTKAGTYYIKAAASIGGNSYSFCSSATTITPGAANKIVALLQGETLNQGSSSPAKTGAPAPSSRNSLHQFPIDVYLTDANHNPITSYTGGTVSVSCQDPRANEPTLSSGVFSSGYAQLWVLPRAVGAWTCTVTASAGSLSNTTSVTSNIVVDDVCSDPTTPFHGGDGTPSKPYAICSQADLAMIDDQTPYLDANYVLASDIVLSGTWTPIGNQSQYFNGSFNGEGHTISNLSIGAAGSTSNYQGLFGYAGPAALISDLNVGVEAIYGLNGVGAVVGKLYQGTVERVKVKIPAAKFVSGFSKVGGIVGEVSSGIVRDSYVLSNAGARGFVMGTGDISNAAKIGGAVGSLTGGTVRRVSVDTNVQCLTSSSATCSQYSQAYGGVIGYAYAGSDIQQAYFSGGVYGGNYVGGLVGDIDLTTSGTASLKASYVNLTNLKTSSDVATGVLVAGGLVGRINNSSGTMSLGELYSFGPAIGVVGGAAGQSVVGSLVGTVGSTVNCGTLTPCFGDSTMALTVAGSGTLSNAIPKTRTEVQTASTFSAWNFTATNDHDGYPSTGVWMNVPGGGAPQQQWMSSTAFVHQTAAYPTGHGSTISVVDGLRVKQIDLGTVNTTTVFASRAFTTVGSHKWYWEVTIHPSANSKVAVGIAPSTQSIVQGLGFGTAPGWGFFATGNIMHYVNGGSINPVAYGSAFGPGDVIGVRYDASSATKKLHFDVNGVSQSSAGSQAFTLSTGTYYPAVGSYAGGDYDVSINFGTEPFKYGLPTGYEPFNYVP